MALRVSLTRFVRWPSWAVRLLASPVCNGVYDDCLLTLSKPHEMSHTVVGSDGRCYDAMALRRWVFEWCNSRMQPPVSCCVVPGCPITHIACTPFPIWVWLQAWRRYQTSHRRLVDGISKAIRHVVRARRKSVPHENVHRKWRRVWYDRRMRPLKPFRGSTTFAVSANSAFDRVESRSKW